MDYLILLDQDSYSTRSGCGRTRETAFIAHCIAPQQLSDAQSAGGFQPALTGLCQGQGYGCAYCGMRSHL
eukprot:3016002-Amphidinium_carterae.2